MRKFVVIIAILASAGISTNACAQGLGQSMIDVGGGYQIPLAKASNNMTLLQSQVTANIPDGLSCGSINWSQQLHADLINNANLAALNQVGQNALAASESYLMAALRPTFFETLQNMIKNGNQQLNASQASCHAIEAQINKYDPLGVYAKQKRGQAIQKAVASGQTFDQATADASAISTSYSLNQDEASSGLPPDRAVALAASTGDQYVVDGNGTRKESTSAPDSQTEERVLKKIRHDAMQAVTDRYLGNTSCNQPLFSDSASQKRIAATMAPAEKALAGAKAGSTPAINRDAVLSAAAEQELSQENQSMISCSTINQWMQYDPNDRVAVMGVVSNRLALDGMRLQLQQAVQDLQTVQAKHPDQKTLISQTALLQRLQDEMNSIQATMADADAARMAMIQADIKSKQAVAARANQQIQRNVANEPVAPTAPSIIGY